jgi:hypothetical protein
VEQLTIRWFWRLGPQLAAQVQIDSREVIRDGLMPSRLFGAERECKWPVQTKATKQINKRSRQLAANFCKIRNSRATGKAAKGDPKTGKETEHGKKHGTISPAASTAVGDLCGVQWATRSGSSNTPPGGLFPYSSGTKYRKDRIYRATRTVVHIRYVRVIAAETIPEAFGPQSSGSLTTVSANDYQSSA